MSKIPSNACAVLAAILLLTTSSAAIVRAAEPATGAAEQANLDALLHAIQSNRKALVAANLKLTDAEATKFWPTYDRYQKEINAIGERLAAVIQDYSANFKTLSDDKAMKLIDEYLAVEADRVKVRRSYVAEFAKAIPGRSVARFYQIENKMDAVLRYDLASKIPVVDEEATPPAK